MLLVPRIADRLQQIVETGYTATVFRWPVSLPIQARGVRASWFRRQTFLNHDLMLPAIA